MPTGIRAIGLPPLTHQQKSFIRHFVQCRRVGDAAIRAGYSDKQYGSQLLKLPQVRQAILASMEKSGITDELLAKKMMEGLDATYPAQYYKGDGGVKQQESPDYHTRREYLDTAIKIRGDYAPEKIEQFKKTVNISLTIDAESAQGLLDSGRITELEYDHLKQLWAGKDIAEREDATDEKENNEPGSRTDGQTVGDNREGEGRDRPGTDAGVAGESE